jgi:hypothetical protein
MNKQESYSRKPTKLSTATKSSKPFDEDDMIRQSPVDIPTLLSRVSWERDAHILATAMATETVSNLEKSNTTPLDRPGLRKHLSQIVRSAAGIVALDSGGEVKYLKSS